MTAPEDLNYTISGRELVAENDGMRVQVLTLQDGDFIPWHWHSSISDIFVGLAGTVVVETKAPRTRHELGPGEHCVVPPRTAHKVSSKAGGGCRFTIVQGVGEHDYFPFGEPAGVGQ